MWPMRMDHSTPTHDIRKFVKIYKYVLPQKQTVVAEVCGGTYTEKMILRLSRKTATDVKTTLQNKGERLENSELRIFFFHFKAIGPCM